MSTADGLGMCTEVLQRRRSAGWLCRSYDCGRVGDRPRGGADRGRAFGSAAAPIEGRVRQLGRADESRFRRRRPSPGRTHMGRGHAAIVARVSQFAAIHGRRAAPWVPPGLLPGLAATAARAGRNRCPSSTPRAPDAPRRSLGGRHRPRAGL